MKISVKLFASYRDRAGVGDVHLDLQDGATVGDLAREMLSIHPNLLKDPSRLVVAVNDEFRDHQFDLHDGDEAALIPPVSGGVY